MTAFTNCAFCGSALAYRLMNNDTLTAYTGTDVWIEAGTNDLIISSETALSLRGLYIEAYVDISTKPDCAFILPIQIPLEIEICGTENVLVADPTPWNLTYYWHQDANGVLSNVTS